MNPKLEGKKIYNDVIDEAYELEDGEDVLEEKSVRNQLVDMEVDVSNDSNNYVPTPRNDNERLDQPDFDDHYEKMEPSYTHNKARIDEISKEISQLNLDDEAKEIFNYLVEYAPKDVELEVSLKPFVPDFIPAVGEVDAFLKLPRPDCIKESLGLERLDEPALNMSKKSYLDLLIKEFYKGKAKADKKEVHTVSNAHKNPKELHAWVKDVETVHKGKVAPTVFYNKKMPDIDALMQTWDSDFESVAQKINLMQSDVPIPLDSLSKICCNILDIPVHDTKDDKNLIESLHVMFSLYSSFMANDHFQNGINNGSNSMNTTNNLQRIEFN